MSAEMSRLALGCARIGSFNNAQSLSESCRLIEQAMDLGVTTIDTSNIYGQGDSERAIGSALQHMRDTAFIVTKAGRRFSARMQVLRPLKPLLRPALAIAQQRRAKPQNGNAVSRRREAELLFDWSPAALTQSLEQSLRRLRTDRIDGLLLHSPPPAIAADEAVGRALEQLKRDGKVRRFGVSCDDLETLLCAMEMPGLSLVQLPWPVIARLDPHTSARIRAQGIGVMAREVIRAQPAIDAGDAVQRSLDHALVSTTVIGTTNAAHLCALARLARGANVVTA